MNKEKQTSILKTAIKRFTKHGLNKTTLDEVARDMRLSKATLYHYFTSKEELFLASIKYEGYVFLEEIQKIFENTETPLKGSLIEYYKLKKEFLVKHRLLYDILLLYYTESISENEKAIISDIITEEIKLVKNSLKDIYSNKNENIIFELPVYLVKATWGEIFSPRLNDIAASNEEAYLNIIEREIEALIS